MSDFHDGFSNSVMPHLIELRKRLLFSIVFFITSSVLAYLFNKEIMTFLAKPLLGAENGPQRLIYTGLTEAFVTFVKVSCFAGCLLSVPFFVLQLWLFVRPGMYKSERNSFRPFLLMSLLLFFFGLAFAYFCVLPTAWDFFLNFQNSSAGEGIALSLEARVSEYVSLSMQIMLAFSFCFQMPVVLLVLGKLGILSYKVLAKSRRYIILIILVISAILTPPDVLSMIALACPLYALFEMALIFIRRMDRKRSLALSSLSGSSIGGNISLDFEE